MDCSRRPCSAASPPSANAGGDPRLVKIAVYTIALNEAAHAERWANSAIDADYRIVADTGSTDDTVERLTQAGVTVHRIAVRPWRFDVARNTAMALIPADVDVCCTMDMDEFLEPGWRPKLEATWTPETTSVYCRLARQSSLNDPMPKVWPAQKFHARWGYQFKRAVHEALFFVGGHQVAGDCPGILMRHIPDGGKGTRAQYLPLMELAYKEDPEDSQICFWLGRDYMWANRPEEAIEVFQHYLALPSSTWTDERSEAMRYLARMQPHKKMFWLDRARVEAPHRRETWLDLAEEFRSRGDWLNLFWACANGIEKTYRTNSYLDDADCWGFRLYDLGAIACWNLNVMDRACEWGKKALELDPGNQRLQGNLDLYLRRRGEIGLGEVTLRFDTPRAQLFTTFGTVLYVEAGSGQLRHSVIDGSPANAALTADQSLFEGSRTGWLMHDADDGLYPIGCTADGCWSTFSKADSGASFSPTLFQLVPLERGLVGLQSGGRYLCAEPDGRVTLSRSVCSLWECFLPSATWCSEPPTSDAERTNATINWAAVESFVINRSLANAWNSGAGARSR
jgi:glycosyltransferase involved in cell wall biosynthesis